MILLPSHAEEELVVGCSLPSRWFDETNCQYGAKFVAAKYCKISFVPTGYPGEWQHAWHPEAHNVHHELVIGSDGLSEQRKHRETFWVARKDQVDYLSACGYRRVKAIGLPIAYVPTPSASRKAGSLLVMPMHSLPDTSHDWNSEEYADYISSISKNFSRVVVCVHPSCFAKGYWVSAFRRRSINVISGADIADRNSLERMATLFSGFDYITSNSFGSYLAYGAAFGCKPSISGPLAKLRAVDFEKSLIYVNAPELLPRVIMLHSEPHLKKAYPDLFCSPWKARSMEKWGKWQIGVQCRRSPQELRSMFCWSPVRKRVYAAGIKLSRLKHRICNNRLTSKLRRCLFEGAP